MQIRITKASRAGRQPLPCDPLPCAGAERRVYVARPSVLGNPFVIGRDGSRKQVIARYRAWLWQQLQQTDSPQRRALEDLLEQARRQPLALQCWCHSLPCHAQVIRATLLWMAGQGR